MCECDIGPKAFYEVTRKARVEHRCCECRNVIAPGQTYEYASGIWDEGPMSFKTCLPCVDERKAYVAQLNSRDCQPCFGELYEGYPPEELPPHHQRSTRAAA